MSVTINKVKKIIAPIALILSILLTFVLVKGFAIEREPKISKEVISLADYVERVEVCTDKDFSGTNIFSKAVLNCLSDEVFRPLITQEDFTMLNKVVHEAELKYPAFYLPCHNLMHTLVKFLPRDSKKLVQILREIEEPSCQGGLVHGIFDAVAALNVTPEVLKEFALVCTEREDMYLKSKSQVAASLSAYCSDASGHAAYGLTNNLEGAVKICNDILSYGKQISACVEGVMMQRYQPASGVGGLGYMMSHIELPKFCDSLKGKYKTDDVFLGCHDGAGYVYMRKAHDAQSCPTDQSCSESELNTKINSAISEVYLACKRDHDDAKQSRCSDKMSMQMPGFIYSKDNYRESACAIFVNSQQKITCNRFALVQESRVEKGFA